MPNRKTPFLPRPPVSRNATEFVVSVFVIVVATVLMLAVIFLAIAELVAPEEDRSSTLNAITDIMNTIIGALIGFVAGKGQGRVEVTEELKDLERGTPNS